MSSMAAIVEQLNILLLHIMFDEEINMVFNCGMDDRELIMRAGGPAKLAAKLNYDKRSGVQRVHNWMTRGIPARVKLEHPEIFLVDLPAPAPTPEKEGGYA